MVRIFRIIMFFLVLIHTNCYTQDISDSLSIYFYENEILIEKVRLIALNKNLEFKKIINLEKGVILKQNLDFKNNIYFIEAECHLVSFPEVDYLEKVNYLDINYYSKRRENKFIKLYGDDFFQAGKENYYFSFGFGDIILTSIDKNKIRENKKKIKKAKNHDAPPR